MMAEIIIIVLITSLLCIAGFNQWQQYKNNLIDQPKTKLTPQMTDLAIASSQQSIWDWDMGAKQFSISPILERHLGYKEAALCGNQQIWIDLIHLDDRQTCLASFANIKKYKNNAFRMEFRLRHLEGHYLWIELNATMIGERCVGLASDITARKRTEQALLLGAIYDPLTNLPNRALFLDRLGNQLNLLGGEKNNIALVLLDIVGFRALNQQLGVAASDSLLLMVAERIKTQLEPSTNLARVGADEFAIALPVGSQDQLTQWVSGLNDSLQAGFKFKDKEIILRFSLGWALSKEVSASSTALMEAAGIAMQLSLRQKKPVQFHAALQNDNVSRNVLLEADLHKALERNEIELHYQPIVQISDTKVWGFEALMRWRHPSLGLISPAEFIPIAEEGNLIEKLGVFAMERATKAIAQWQLTYNYTPPLFVNVNISRRELFRESLVADVKSIISRNFLTPGQLKLEITESLLIKHPENIIPLLEQLRQAGAAIAIDDFGSGYSSLSWLQQLPFDVIKLDRTFIGEHFLTKQTKTNAIIKAVVEMAHNMGAQIVAEGADSSQKAFWLKEETLCDYAQGFYYAPPMEAEEVLSFLPRNRPR